MIAAPMIALKRFVLFAVLWLALTSADPGALAVGAATAAAVMLASLRLMPPRGPSSSIFGLASLLPGFLAGSIRGGFDVAWRAFQPSMPLNPGWIAYPVSLPRGVPRMTLGSELSLMPGTLAAGGDDQSLFIHCLDTDQPVGRPIAEEERRIAEGFGLARGQRSEGR